MITVEDFYDLDNKSLAKACVMLMLVTGLVDGEIRTKEFSPIRPLLLKAIADLTPVQAASLAEQVSRLLKIRLEGADAT